MMRVQLLDPRAKAPLRQPSSDGFDVFALEPAVVPSGQRCLVRTGVAIASPPGFYAQIFPRSGLALKSGIMTMGGVIDADYRGEVKVLLFNSSDVDFIVQPMDRIAQILQLAIATPGGVEIVDDLGGATARGDGGFGSTGQ
jgi:dUTP pyrophosphatase